MMRDITIGQYYPENSPIHALDPRTKLMCTLIYIVALFITDNPIVYIGCAVFAIVLYYIAKVPFSYLLKGLRGIIILLILTFIFRMIATPGEVIWHWKFIEVTHEGIIKAVSLTSRIALMITGASLLAYTSTPKDLADGMEKGLSFLQKVRIPIHEMAVIVMIAFRFIPILIEELNVLMDAQAARGARYEEAGTWTKCKSVCALLMPMFLSTLRRSADLAMAMEARGYTGHGHATSMYPLVYKKRDAIAYICMALFFAIIIALKIAL